MRIDEINRDREAFLTNIQTSLEPELSKLGLILINVNVTDITDESGYIEAIGQKAASEAIQKARGDVADNERMGEIRVAEAEKDKAIQVANAQKERVVGTREAEREQTVKTAQIEQEQAVRLAELDRVEREHPDRAETAEFSPLRNKRATCQAAIDSIRFDQVDQNERAIAVTDTTQLERKWRKKKGLPLPDDPADAGKGKAKPAAMNTPPAAVSAPTNTPPATVSTPTNTPPAKVSAPRTAVRKKKLTDAEFAQRMETARTEIRNKDYAAADLLLEALAAERPNELNVLLLRAAAQVGTGSRYAARRTLEKAMRAHPKSYLPYYNLAYLSLKLEEGAETARQYYEMGRTVGGPSLPALEAQLNGKGM
jgi:uncharacterized membrane protein YqiK